MSDLLVIVPSRGRPESVARVVAAWQSTGAWEDADLLFAIDNDDPMRDRYIDAAPAGVSVRVAPRWQPMVHKLNAASAYAASRPNGYFALGFAGDDHLPRTPGWAGDYLAKLRELGTGIVYGDDGIQGQQLPTQWAMTSDIIRTLGRMVPADVEHLYCDNAVRDLGVAAGCLRYLPDVLIEHMHPVAGKAPMDAGYARVNRQEQYRRDRLAYEWWRTTQMPMDAGIVRTLRTRMEV